MKVENRYIDGTYLEKNPIWDREDSPWKVKHVNSVLQKFDIKPKSICEIGCGPGDNLIHMNKIFPTSQLFGFDISPQLRSFWKENLKNNLTNGNLKFCLGDFHKVNKKKYDLIMMLDVFEHVRDPFTFLENSIKFATYFIFHIPLDLSAMSVLRNIPLLDVREKAGHLHYYTKDLALETLKDSGYEILYWKYTQASLSSPNRSLKTKLMSIPRTVFYSIHKDLGVRLLGGETLMVLATAKKTPRSLK
ncbi:class I SAM-dependent methyltransferase [Leptospira noguchii]|uniref:Methyltransferase domain protein n=1 Tax=Leptospira noguchii TaxID=28182 RepID=M6VJN0_9LEPT|nr:class I SAM-dependent methyltransferase [Leptospira noguchii]EMO53359.1 methyltransferase domain protein [Leptospira noguchii]